MIKPVFLCILDGWGASAPADDNAIYHANTPNWDKLVEQYGMSLLTTDGEAVGLPAGQMGNSEVGHMTIGSGRILLQDLPRIDKAVKTGELAENALIKKIQGRCHIMGCFSDGGVHAHIDHIKGLAKILQAQGAEVILHAFLDGRDVSQKSALSYLSQIEGVKIATISGRYYAMDRDKRWDRVEKTYNAIVMGEGEKAETAEAGVEASYAQDVTDEFTLPTVIGDYAGMQDGDSFIMANFRADRAREIIQAIADPGFDGFARSKEIQFSNKIGMVEYSDAHNEYMETLFGAEVPINTMPEVVANAGLRQLRTAETEKYAHVTFFMSGGREAEFAGEKRLLVPSPQVATYDLQPEMSASQVTDGIVSALNNNEYDLIIANYANTDMVGHTGDFEAAKKAVEAVDAALGRLIEAVDAAGGVMLISADHGNADDMLDDEGNPHTQHSLNKVPFVAAGQAVGKQSLQDGSLADLAPTALYFLGLEIPAEMTGKVLVS